MDKKTEKENKLQLIPKIEKYIEYILQIILKLPRTEKFSIGNEYKLIFGYRCFWFGELFMSATMLWILFGILKS